ncbi:hypothetical protein CUR178_02568 [Leishmania enriettii]|uniref:Uncharacterized protein n=1 Tax=Leishmania enriettii TaxID=5663 RepID=A0A836GY72_LEIEN|nr:hypothetical protein CUR178_02568 [Leishmania enriettii]
MPLLGPCTSVPPKLCTVAFLKPDVILHRVRPVFSREHKAQCWFTVWFHGTLTSSDDNLFLKAQYLYKGAVPFLRRSAVQRLLSRAVYKPEHAGSLLQTASAPTRRHSRGTPKSTTRPCSRFASTRGRSSF